MENIFFRTTKYLDNGRPYPSNICYINNCSMSNFFYEYMGTMEEINLLEKLLKEYILYYIMAPAFYISQETKSYLETSFETMNLAEMILFTIDSNFDIFNIL